jgi:hypothetical protein
MTNPQQPGFTLTGLIGVLAISDDCSSSQYSDLSRLCGDIKSVQN